MPKLMNGINWMLLDSWTRIHTSIQLQEQCPQSVLHTPIVMHRRDTESDPIREAWDAVHAPEDVPKPEEPYVVKPVPTFAEIMNQHKSVSG